MKKYCTIFLIFLSVAACKKESVKDFDKVSVTFRCGTDTRVLDDAWAIGDRIGVFMIRASSPLADTSIVEQALNSCYVSSDSSRQASFVANTPAQSIYFPVNGSAVDFYAYYPYQANLGTGGDYNYPIDVRVQSEQSVLDLMTATALNKSKRTSIVNLNFRHKLTKMKLTIVPGAGLTQTDLQGLEVKVIGLPTKASLCVGIDTINQRRDVGDIVAKTANSGRLSEAILIPCPATAGAKVAFKLQQTSEVFYWDISGMPLQSGKKYEYTVTLSRTGANINGVISDWIGSSGSGSAN